MKADRITPLEKTVQNRIKEIHGLKIESEHLKQQVEEYIKKKQSTSNNKFNFVLKENNDLSKEGAN